MNEEARRVGLKINKGKTKVMRNKMGSQKKVTVDGQDIGEIEEFNYLGATICKDGGGMKDLKNRIPRQDAHLLDLKKYGTQGTSRRGPSLDCLKPQLSCIDATL